MDELHVNGKVQNLIHWYLTTMVSRYTKSANWDYLKRCKALCTTSALIGSGDVLSWNEYNEHLAHVDNVLIGKKCL